MRRLALAFLVVCAVLWVPSQAQAAVVVDPPSAQVRVGYEKSFRVMDIAGRVVRNVAPEVKLRFDPPDLAQEVAPRNENVRTVKVLRKGSGHVIFEMNGQEVARARIEGIEGPGDEDKDWRDSSILRMIGGALCGIAEIVYGFPGFQTLDVLVFGKDGPKVAGVFTEREWEAITRWYRLFAGIGLSGYAVYLVLLIHGLRGLAGSSGPAQRASLMEALTDTLVAMCFAVFGLAGLRAMLEVNQALVNAICTWMGTEGAEWVRSFNREMLRDLVVPYSLFWTGVARVVFAFTAITLNFLYLVRKFVLAVSVVLLPVVGWAWAFKGTRLPVLILGTEMVTNSLMSFSHALVLALMWDLFYRSGPGPAAGGIPGQLLGVLSRGVEIVLAASGLAALIAVAVSGYRIAIAVTAQDRVRAYERLCGALVAAGFLFGAWVIMQVLLEVVLQ